LIRLARGSSQDARFPFVRRVIPAAIGREDHEPAGGRRFRKAQA